MSSKAMSLKGKIFSQTYFLAALFPLYSLWAFHKNSEFCEFNNSQQGFVYNEGE